MLQYKAWLKSWRSKKNEDYMPFGQHYLELGLDDNMTTAEYDDMAANNRHITSEILQ